jgi:hypothetical protein
MNKQAKGGFDDLAALTLSPDEIAELRALMKVVRYDANERALVIDTGKARLAVREDGTVRIDAGRVVGVAERDIRLDGARIELN